MEDSTSVEGKKISNAARIALVYLCTIILGVALASRFAEVYISIFHPSPDYGFFGFSLNPGNLLDGFIIGYSFLLSLAVALFITLKKHQFWTWFFGMVVFLLVLLYDLSYLGFVILVSLLGYLIGLGVLYLKKRIAGMRRAN